jgi:hypothetical protein
MDPVLLPLLMFGVGVVVVTMSMGAKQAKMIDGAWEASARLLEGRYVPRALGQARQVTAERSGREVVIDHAHLRIGEQHAMCTRLRCRAEGPGELKLRITPAGGFSGLARAVGFEDVPVGDEDFDAEYVIKASDPEIASLWLNAAVRKRIQAVPDFRFKLERGRVEALCPYLVDEPSLMVAAVEAAVSFADGRQRLARAWKKLAREHGGRLELVTGGWARLDLEIDGVPVMVTTRDLGDRHFTVVTAEAVGPTLPEMVLSHERHLHEAVLPIAPDARTPEGYELFTREPERFAAVFDGGVMAAVEALEPVKVRLDPDRVTVLVAGLEIRREVLRRAIALAIRLAGRANLGTYR